MTPTMPSTLEWSRNIAVGENGRRYEISVGRKGLTYVLTLPGDAPNYKGTREQCLEYAEKYEATQRQIDGGRVK